MRTPARSARAAPPGNVARSDLEQVQQKTFGPRRGKQQAREARADREGGRRLLATTNVQPGNDHEQEGEQRPFEPVQRRHHPGRRQGQRRRDRTRERETASGAQKEGLHEHRRRREACDRHEPHRDLEGNPEFEEGRGDQHPDEIGVALDGRALVEDEAIPVAQVPGVSERDVRIVDEVDGNGTRVNDHEAREDEGGQKALDRATELKRGIRTLKDSEKDVGEAFGDALETSTVLKGIKKNTDSLGKMQ